MLLSSSKFLRSLAVSLAATAAFAGTNAVAADRANWPNTSANHATPKVKGMPKELARNLANFDNLDFVVYSGQQWENLHKSHAKDILVHYPDGHTTQGLEDHLKELKFMFTFAPDNRITEHAVRFGTADGQWTAVIGFIDGSFTKPMALPDGSAIPPTGKKYHLSMSTLSHWNKDGVMDEEYLFWDNAALMTQIGLGK